MSKHIRVQRIRLRGGIEFEAVFERCSNTSVVVKAEGRNPMRVMKHDDNKWSARVDGSGTVYYNEDPAKSFALCASAQWRKERDSQAPRKS